MFNFTRRQEEILHLTWAAFFLTFVAWFNMAPFNTTLMQTMGLSVEQVKILMICNVALTIPARIIIGSLVDLYGPRKVYTAILIFGSLVCFQFALAESFLELLISRLLMGIVGAGFVVGIKMIGKWFPSQKMGIAQGIYGGWGNFGAAAAAFTLPPLASLFPINIGWRVAIGFCGILCLIWACIYYRFSEDSPHCQQDYEFTLNAPLEVANHKDLSLLVLIQVPIYIILGSLVWKLSGNPLNLFPLSLSFQMYILILIIFVVNVGRDLRFNLPRLAAGVPEERHYEFRQIFILSFVYSFTFGSELAVISMFPQHLQSLFGLSVTKAGMIGSSFAFMNLITRPGGGWFSDCFGRKRSLIILVSGSIICFAFMSQITSQWSLLGAVGMAVLCSAFLQSGNGSCFSMVPLIRKDLTGRMAGLAGAYGNVGSVLFLIIFSFVNEAFFFKLLAGYGGFVLLTITFLPPFIQETS